MSMHVAIENPNDVCGGGGCMCHVLQSPDTKGPYIVFPENEMDNPLSPHAVLCSGCVEQAVHLFETDPDADYVEGTVED